MKKLILILALLISGCDGSDIGHSPQEVIARCNTVVTGETTDPGIACFDDEPNLITAEDFGDSHSLGWEIAARHDLCGVVDFRHDPWAAGDVDICGDRYHPYVYGPLVADGYNDGNSTQLLALAEQELSDPGTHRNIITYNSGYHDMIRRNGGDAAIALDVYRNNLEAVAQILEKHADVVIWVDSAPMPWERAFAGGGYVLAKDIPVYNAIARDIAREHGFYRLTWQGDPPHDPNHDLHFNSEGSSILGEQVAVCVLVALDQSDTDYCRR